MAEQDNNSWDALQDRIFWLLEEAEQHSADMGAAIAAGDGAQADRCYEAWERTREKLQALRKQQAELA